MQATIDERVKDIALKFGFQLLKSKQYRFQTSIFYRGNLRFLFLFLSCILSFHEYEQSINPTLLYVIVLLYCFIRISMITIK